MSYRKKSKKNRKFRVGDYVRHKQNYYTKHRPEGVVTEIKKTTKTNGAGQIFQETRIYFRDVLSDHWDLVSFPAEDMERIQKKREAYK